MKNFLVLLLYLTGAIASVYGFRGNLPPYPRLFATRMRRLQPRPLTIIPRPIHRQDIRNFLYWKHLLELECLKEICGHYEDRLEHKRPIEATRHRLMPAFRNDGTAHRDHIPNIFKIKENKAQSEPENKRKFSGNERIILWPPERNFTDVFPTKQGLGQTPREPPERLRGNLKAYTPMKDFMHQRTDYRFPISFLTHTTEPQDVFGSTRVFPGNDSPRKVVPEQDPSPELFKNLGVIRSSTAMYPEDTPYGFRHRMRPDRIQPYEVEEIVEEKFMVDVNENDKDEDGFKSVAENHGMDIRTNEMERTEHFQRVIDSSVSKILKGLISPAVKLSPDKNVLHPENHERPHDWRQETEDVPQKSTKGEFKPEARVENSRGLTKSPVIGEVYMKNLLLVEPPKRPVVTEADDQQTSKISNTDHFQSDLPDDSRRRSMSIPEEIPKLPPIEALTGLDFLRNLMANITHAEEMISSTNSESPSTHSLPPFTTSESAEEAPSTTEFMTTDSKVSKAILNESDAETLTTEDFLKTVKYFPEGHVSDEAETEHNFIEFSDHPLSFDLLTTTIKLDSEKDQETIWKSSRRMHFGPESPRTTVSNGISGTAEGQRRSDILITDNLADYVDDDKLSTLGYIERLKQDNALVPSGGNLTLEALIPFIPVVINDLREDKIPPEDIPMLSRALGKYWSSVLALSNFTNLDMLPLVKMKDQTDLENVLQNFLPEDKTSTTVGRTESEPRTHDDYSQSYDYLEDYKDLYKDILDQDLGDRRRRFRPRRNAEDHLTLEATREYFDSIEQERSDEGSEYIIEDIVYDEVSEGEDESVFELMEVSDVHFDKET